jgi:hypothetical protein
VEVTQRIPVVATMDKRMEKVAQVGRITKDVSKRKKKVWGPLP